MLHSKLTPRQRQVALLVPQGFTNKEIGRQLGIQESVTKNYLREIFDRLGVFNRLELTIYVIQHEHLPDADAPTIRKVPQRKRLVHYPTSGRLRCTQGGI